MINLCRLSYMQAGVQIHGSVDGLKQRWDQLLHYLDARRFQGSFTPAIHEQYNFQDLQHTALHPVLPLRVAHG